MATTNSFVGVHLFAPFAEAPVLLTTVTTRNEADISVFANSPLLLADMQSADGSDSSTLRAHDATAFGTTLWVEEEQSRDSEVGHTTETAGYLALA